MSTEPRTRITRLPEKGSVERAELDQLLDTVHIGHVALIADGGPVVVPTAVARDGDRVLVHGSTGSRWMRLLAAGAPASLAITAFDGMVVARTAFESSMLYRSAVLFGSLAPVRGADKRRALDVMTSTLLPGRVAEVRDPSAKEFAATLVLAMPIERWSLKISDKWPDDLAEDIAGDAWAGVIRARITYDDPLPAPDLRDGIAMPPSVQDFGRGRAGSDAGGAGGPLG